MCAEWLGSLPTCSAAAWMSSDMALILSYPLTAQPQTVPLYSLSLDVPSVIIDLMNQMVS